MVGMISYTTRLVPIQASSTACTAKRHTHSTEEACTTVGLHASSWEYIMFGKNSLLRHYYNKTMNG